MHIPVELLVINLAPDPSIYDAVVEVNNEKKKKNKKDNIVYSLNTTQFTVQQNYFNPYFSILDRCTLYHVSPAHCIKLSLTPFKLCFLNSDSAEGFRTPFGRFFVISCLFDRCQIKRAGKEIFPTS